jgi:hypothetical protein
MKRKRTSRAKNKIQGAPEGSLVKVGPAAHTSAAPETHLRTRAIAVMRSSLFTAELEEAIDLIARERVYRAMLDGLRRRMLLPRLTDDRPL